jgi:hypothetical protein
MYKVPSSSCMTIGLTASFESSATPMRTLAYRLDDVWPSMAYAYCKQVQGLYLTENKEPVARVFMLREKITGPFTHWGSLYVKDGQHKTKYQNALVAAIKDSEFGKTKLAHMFKLARLYRFAIPSFLVNERLLCPVPYADNWPNGTIFAYDPENDQFIVNPTKKDMEVCKKARRYESLYDTWNYLDTQLRPVRSYVS